MVEFEAPCRSYEDGSTQDESGEIEHELGRDPDRGPIGNIRKGDLFVLNHLLHPIDGGNEKKQKYTKKYQDTLTDF